MICAVADTHALIWYLYNDARLSPAAHDLIENTAASGGQIALSSITLIEIVYLIEKGRIDSEVLSRLLSELDVPDATLVEIPVDRGCIEFLRRVPTCPIYPIASSQRLPSNCTCRLSAETTRSRHRRFAQSGSCDRRKDLPFCPDPRPSHHPVQGEC
jgi:PIN domain nuclease of toxin-antitoxin system